MSNGDNWKSSTVVTAIISFWSRNGADGDVAIARLSKVTEVKHHYFFHIMFSMVEYHTEFPCISLIDWLIIPSPIKPDTLISHHINIP